MAFIRTNPNVALLKSKILALFAVILKFINKYSFEQKESQNVSEIEFR